MGDLKHNFIIIRKAFVYAALEGTMKVQLHGLRVMQDSITTAEIKAAVIR
jgi:hypothetical protein